MANIWGTYARASFPGNWTPVFFFTSKAMATHSSTLAWKSPWTAAHGVVKSWTRLSDFSFTLTFHFSLSCIGEGNGNPLQCSYLENPRDGGAWWAAVYGVAQSRTRLKRLSSSSSSIKCILWFKNSASAFVVFSWEAHNTLRNLHAYGIVRRKKKKNRISGRKMRKQGES